MLIAFQTLYQFSAITTMKSDSTLAYPEPASTFAELLSFSLLDFVAVVPTSCVFPTATFYTEVCSAEMTCCRIRLGLGAFTTTM